MTKAELLRTLAEIGVQPSRKLGQNFLIDGNMLEAMMRDARPLAGERILEIGPGTGILTAKLLAAGCRVLAIEFDHRLAAYLGRRFAGCAAFQLLEADGCQVDYQALLAGEAFRCIANLPYAASSVLVARLINLPNPPRKMDILLQREMAERLAAAPNTKPYGALTVQVGSLYAAKILRRLPPGVFFPPPEVESAFLGLRVRDDAPVLAGPRPAFASFVRQAFGQRRKKLSSTLAKIYGRETVAAGFAVLGVGDNARPEDLSADRFVELFNFCGRERCREGCDSGGRQPF